MDKKGEVHAITAKRSQRLNIMGALLSSGKLVMAKLWQAVNGMRFYFLPPYSPELNRIEMLWRKMKYERLPFQSISPGELEDAIDEIGAGFGSQYQFTFC